MFSGLSLEDMQSGARPPDAPDKSLRPSARGMERAVKGEFPKPYEPMLPTLTRDVFQRADWLYEPKLDGFRVLAFFDGERVHLRTRGGQAYEERFPEIARALAAQPVDQAVFDGEIVALGPDGRASFQRLQNRASDPNASLRFYVFDLLYLDGYDLRGVPLAERKQVLHAVLAPIGGVEEVSTFDDGPGLFHAAEANRLEGIIAKKRDSVYEADRRVRTWLKIKTSLSDEFVIAGYTLGTGRRTETLGSLILGSYDDQGKLRYAGHVGTGFDEAGLQSMLRRLQPLQRATSPFDEPVPRGGGSSRTGGTGVWVEPTGRGRDQVLGANRRRPITPSGVSARARRQARFASAHSDDGRGAERMI